MAEAVGNETEAERWLVSKGRTGTSESESVANKRLEVSVRESRQDKMGKTDGVTARITEGAISPSRKCCTRSMVTSLSDTKRVLMHSTNSRLCVSCRTGSEVNVR